MIHAIVQSFWETTEVLAGVLAHKHTDFMWVSFCTTIAMKFAAASRVPCVLSSNSPHQRRLSRFWKQLHEHSSP